MPSTFLCFGLQGVNAFNAASKYLSAGQKVIVVDRGYRGHGALTVNGQSLNFITFVTLPSEASSAHWIKRSVALIASLDD